MSRSPIVAVSRVTVAWRRLVARRPWLYWIVIAAAALAAASQVSTRLDDVDDARAAWGTTRTVLVAAEPAAPGEALIVTAVEVPLAVVPAAALAAHDTSSLVARQAIGVGEIVTEPDVTGGGPLALVPPGWLAVPVIESPPSGASAGDLVRLVSEGVVLAPDAVVAGHHDDVSLIAVPADVAAVIPTASAAGTLVVLRHP
jgi:hypothetical protein